MNSCLNPVGRYDHAAFRVICVRGNRSDPDKMVKDAIAEAGAKYQKLTAATSMATAATEAERLSLSLLRTPYSSPSDAVRGYVDTLAQATAKTKAF